MATTAHQVSLAPPATAEADIEKKAASDDSSSLVSVSDRSLSFAEAFDRKTCSTLLAACCCIQLSAITLYLPNNGLTFIAQAFPTDPVSVSWVASCLTLVIGGISLFLGALTDSIGRRNVLLLGCVFTMVGMPIAATAKNITTIIVGASIGGVGTATGFLVVPICQELVPNRFRPFTLGFANVFNSWVTIAGPCIAGAIVTNTGGDWTWLYWTGLIFAGATFPIVFFLYRPPARAILVGSTRTELFQKFDYVGVVLSLGGVILFLIGLTTGDAPYPWTSGRVLGPLIVGILSIIAFVPWELYGARYPLMPRAIFEERNVTVTLVVTFFFGFLYYALVAFFPQAAGLVYGGTPVQTGVLSLPWTISFTVTMVAVGLLVTYTKSLILPMLVSGASCTAFLAALSTISPENKTQSLVFSAFVGAGLAPLTILSTLGATLCTPPELIGTVASLVTVVRMLGGTIGITSCSIVLKDRVNAVLPERVGGAAIAAGFPQENLVALFTAIPGGAAALAAVPGATTEVLVAVGEAVKSSYSYGFRYVFIMGSAFGACTLIVCLFLTDVEKHLDNHIAAGVHTKQEIGIEPAAAKQA